jgi:hypothetical protein
MNIKRTSGTGYSIVTGETKPMRNNATRETAPYTIWLSNVWEAALAHRPCSVEQINRLLLDRVIWRPRLARWFNAGEPVWMAAEGVADFARDVRIAERAEADNPLRTIRSH